jgi:large subunit ribosomal protein L30
VAQDETDAGVEEAGAETGVAAKKRDFSRPWMNTERVIVTQTRSAIGANPNAVQTLRALGLRRVGASRQHVVSPQLVGMLRKVEHLVNIRPTMGDVTRETPPLSRESVGKYEVDNVQGHVMLSPSGQPVRIEQRGGVLVNDEAQDPSLVVGWTPRGPIKACLTAVHQAGEPGSVFRAVKNGVVHVQDPWRPGTPAFILESPTSVQLVRLDTDNETVVWQRPEHGNQNGEVTVLMNTAGWKGLEDVVLATTTSDVLKMIQEATGLQ